MQHSSTCRQRLFACLVLSAALGGLAGPALAASTPDRPAASASTEAPNEAGVRRATLDNGMKVIVVPNRLAPAVTTVMNYGVGSRNVPRGFPGMAHAQEHMMFRGTDTLSAAQISAISAAMGGQFNADTQDEVTQYYFNVPAPYLDVALRLHAERMKSVKDAQADWAAERGAIEQEVARDLSSPDYVAYTRLREQLFGGTPYSHDALGSKTSFDKTTGKMLKAFHDQWYAPNNATLVIAGDVNAGRTIATVKKLFGGIERKKLPETPPIELSPVKASAIRMPTDAGYGIAYLAYRTPGTDDANKYAASQILAQVLSNPRGALYSQLVATGNSLGTQFAVQGLRAAGIGYAAAAFPKGADSDKLVKQMREILANVGKNGVEPDAIEAAKRQLVTEAAAEQDSIPGQAMAWSQAVAIDRMPSPQAELDALQNVTPEAVNALARQMLARDNSVLTVLTPKGSGAPASGSGFGGGESFTPSHVKDVKLPEWAAKPLATIAVPERPNQPVVSVLSNGLRLIVVPTDATRAVHVYGMIRNNPDLEAPKGRDGVNAVLDRLLSFGTQKHDRVAYQAALDAIGAQARPGTDFSLTVLPDHFKRGLDLLAENELEPALPDKAFSIVKRQIAAATAGTLDSPGFHAGQAMKKGLYPTDDPSLRHATPASIANLTKSDLKSYYQKVFRPDLTTLVIVGHVDAKTAQQAVNRRFGAWQAKGKAPTVDLPGVPANKAANTHVPDSAKVQDTVSLAETVGLRADDPDYYALQVGNQVLTGGFYASRLYRDLRAERGLVYYVHSGLDADRTRTHLGFEYGALPDKVATANRLIADALVQMGNAPVSGDELHRAQAELVRQVALDQASADAIGGGLLSRIDRGVPLDEPYRAAAAYKNVDADAVHAAFKRWIRPEALVRVVQGPAPK